MADLTVVQSVDTQHTEPTGRALIGGEQCLFGDEVRPDDLVLANFDKRKVHTGGALYLLQSNNGWRGCRRLMAVLDGGIEIQDGRGNCTTVRNMDETNWRVVGTVETVYRSTRFQ